MSKFPYHIYYLLIDSFFMYIYYLETEQQLQQILEVQNSIKTVFGWEYHIFYHGWRSHLFSMTRTIWIFNTPFMNDTKFSTWKLACYGFVELQVPSCLASTWSSPSTLTRKAFKLVSPMPHHWFTLYIMTSIMSTRSFLLNILFLLEIRITERRRHRVLHSWFIPQMATMIRGELI